MTAGNGQLCARSRFWASLRLDGELSELEAALLDAHLARCAACREVAAGFDVATRALRAEPPVVTAPVQVAIRRSPRNALLAAAVAAVVVLAAVAGGLVNGGEERRVTAPRPVAVVASVETPDQIRRLRRTSLLNERKLPRDLAAEPV